MNNATSPDAIGWLGEFMDRETESRFRNHTLENARRLIIAAALAIMLATITLAFNDLKNNGHEASLMSARNFQGGVALFCCWLAWWQRHSWRVIYWSTWLMAVGVVISTTVIDLSRPDDYLLHLTMDVLILMGIYIAVPSVRAQILVAGPFSAILIWMILTQKSPHHDIAHLTAPLAVFLANFLGLSMSIIYNRVKRQFYAKAEAETRINESLQAARRELAQLSQLLPICSSCKNIKDEDGEWHDVEDYVEAVSGQRVSHGICPSCARKLYGDDISP